MSYSVITALYQGFTGAPGWTRMKFDGTLTASEASTAAANMRTFLNSLASYMPSTSNYSFQSTVQQYNTSQVLTGEVVMSTVPANVVGTSAAVYAGGSGTVIYWLTDAIFLGSKVKGRTYLVPLTSAAFQADGTLATAVRTAIQLAGTTFVATTPHLVIASKKGEPDAWLYAQSEVHACSVPDRAAQLRSRRD
jgi:hypothetical protein